MASSGRRVAVLLNQVAGRLQTTFVDFILDWNGTFSAVLFSSYKNEVFTLFVM